ncbi:transmembrane protein 131 homolog [Scaptodrosophila lebanonensis]|uniref:Transmembrane protein 131 homolog n=1 Tax=Drosophila lebanonensis TaxID=7225 RepID=A0A6J2TVS6_DROLE|nr:transmembrane protein 131 homolog [Scaptodrosophila lebanonensis]
MYTNNTLSLQLRLLLWLVSACACAEANHQIHIEASNEKLVGGPLEGSFISLDEPLSEPATHEEPELLRELHFVPQQIDFGTWSVGQARSQIVTLFNQHTNRTVHLNSVTGPSPEFHGSFFGSREVPPQGNTTFSVVFLPRQLGAISTDLLIHTSFGRTGFSVRGEGSECPYRLKPLVGIKAPMNATLTPEIHMYNPHERPLQILEVYSSGGEFQLELPSGGSEGPQNLWEIPPHTLKPVIRISFHGRTAGNHSAYIRIKIAEQSDEPSLEPANENVLVIPVEFEILPTHAAYARNPLADFGRLATQQAETLHFKLDMQNEHADANKRKLIGKYLRDIPGLSFDAHNASIVLDPRLFDESATINDLLVVSSGADVNGKAQGEFTVLVRAEIHKGGLLFDGNVTTFVTSSEKDLERKRSLVVRNTFAFPLKLYNVSLSDPIDGSLLDITPVTEQFLLQPGENVELLQLHLKNTQATFKSSLRIESNVTTFEMPVTSCSGLLHVSTQLFDFRWNPEAEHSLELDMGTVPLAAMSQAGFVVLRNNNPMTIKLTDWKFELTKNVYYQAGFIGCLLPQSERELLSGRNDSMAFYVCRQLEEGDVAIFQLAIKTSREEQSGGIFKVSTQYEDIDVMVYFKATMGQLEVEQEQLTFRNCFPGKICTAILSIRSSLVQPLHVSAIKFNRPGLRFKDFNAKGTTISPKTLTKVGRIYFEPSALCKSNCYLKRSSNKDSIFPSSSGGNRNLLYHGVELRQRIELYRQFKRQLNALTLTLHSEELHPLELEFGIDVEWPKLVQAQGRAHATPAVEVGQVQRRSIVITNPTQHALLVDYFLADPKHARSELSLPHEVLDMTSTSCYLTDRDVFRLTDGTPTSPVLLPAGASVSVPIEFSASQAEKYCTLLHVRSNLTLYEAVWLTARAVQSQFRFGNRRPGSTTPLLFELTPEHFETCDGSQGAVEPTTEADGKSHSVMATRTFTARNSGAAPILIEGFLIGNRPCENFGFKVFDCQSFELRENETRKVEIAFSTDFTTSRMLRPLTLMTNLTYDISYSLLAQLPAESLERCRGSLPRPQWEQALRNTAMIVLLTSFILVLFAAVFDYRTIIAHQNAFDAARYKGPIQPTFNLRNIAKLQAEESATPATGVKLDAAQQQKLKIGQTKDMRKRTTLTMPSSNVEKSTTKKAKSWTPWHMDMNVLSQHLQKSSKLVSDTSASAIASAKPVLPNSSSPNEAKTSKKSTPSPQAAQAQPHQPLQTAPRIQRKAKQTISLTPKSKTEPTPHVVIEAQDVRQSAHPKVITTQQENVSPRPTKSSADSPKEREPKVLKEQNGSVKKLGKTPGRERRKEQKAAQLNALQVQATAPKRSGKQRNKQLNFYGNVNTAPTVSPPASPDTLKCITSSWDTSSRASFSDVLQTKQFPSTENGLNWNGKGISTELAATLLGPIGSKKSGSPTGMTSLWEPLTTHDVTSDKSLSLFEMPSNVASVESNTFTGIDLSPPILEQAQLGNLGGIYERPPSHAQWQRSELILKQQQLLLQQNSEQKQHNRQSQDELLQQYSQLMTHVDGNSWPMHNTASSSTWSPIGYAASWQNQVPHTATGVVRPPPGLETTYLQMPVNNPSNMINHVDELAQNLLAPTNAQIEQERTQLPTQYDPFTSPSSIWSDNWRQNQSQSQQQQQQQRNNHMN